MPQLSFHQLPCLPRSLQTGQQEDHPKKQRCLGRRYLDLGFLLKCFCSFLFSTPISSAPEANQQDLPNSEYYEFLGMINHLSSPIKHFFNPIGALNVKQRQAYQKPALCFVKYVLQLKHCSMLDMFCFSNSPVGYNKASHRSILTLT